MRIITIDVRAAYHVLGERGAEGEAVLAPHVPSAHARRRCDALKPVAGHTLKRGKESPTREKTHPDETDPDGGVGLEGAWLEASGGRDAVGQIPG